MQDNSQTTARWSMKFCMNSFVDHRTNPTELQGYRSKVKVTRPDYRIFHHCEIGQKSEVAR